VPSGSESVVISGGVIGNEITTGTAAAIVELPAFRAVIEQTPESATAFTAPLTEFTVQMFVLLLV
jgi:hypothetical protein